MMFSSKKSLCPRTPARRQQALRTASRNEGLTAEEVEELDGALEAIDSAAPKAVGADATSPVSEMIPPPSRHAVPGHSRSKKKRLPGDRMTPRSITFCNSRMLPGHEYSTKRRMVPSSTCVTLLPNFWANVWTKNATNIGMSSLRSRNGGTWLH